MCTFWCHVQREGERERERVQWHWKVRRFQRACLYLLKIPFLILPLSLNGCETWVIPCILVELLNSKERNATFQIRLAVLFKLRYCGLWHRVFFSQHANISKHYSAFIFRYKINAVIEFLLYTDILQRLWSDRRLGLRAEEIRSAPAAGVSRQYENSRGETEFSPQPDLPWRWTQHILSNRWCTLSQHYKCCTVR